MSDKKTAKAIESRVTIDDIRHRAESLQSKAVSEAKSVANSLVGEDGKRALLIAAGLVLVAASVAYYLGTRAGRSARLDDLFSE